MLLANDTIERRARCEVCGSELDYFEFTLGRRCVFHAETPYNGSLWHWLRFAMAEWRIHRQKRIMLKKGLSYIDYKACLGNVAPEIADIQDVKGMETLLSKLKAYG